MFKFEKGFRKRIVQGGSKVGLELWVWETEFIFDLLFINCIIFHANNCTPTFAQPCILNISLVLGRGKNQYESVLVSEWNLLSSDRGGEEIWHAVNRAGLCESEGAGWGVGISDGIDTEEVG